MFLAGAQAAKTKGGLGEQSIDAAGRRSVTRAAQLTFSKGLQSALLS